MLRQHIDTDNLVRGLRGDSEGVGVMMTKARAWGGPNIDPWLYKAPCSVFLRAVGSYDVLRN